MFTKAEADALSQNRKRKEKHFPVAVPSYLRASPAFVRTLLYIHLFEQFIPQIPHHLVIKPQLPIQKRAHQLFQVVVVFPFRHHDRVLIQIIGT